MIRPEPAAVDHPPHDTPLVSYEAVFLASPLPTSLSRLSDGCLLAVNDAWLALSGQRREDVVGKTTLELGHWANAQERREVLTDLVSADRPRQIQHTCDVQGRRVRLHVSVLPGEPEPLLVSVLIDISAEWEASQALQHSHDQLKQQVQLHEAIERLGGLGHWTNGDRADEVVWSPGLFRVAGLDPAPVISREAGRSGIHPDDRPAWQAAREALDERETLFRWLRPDGSERLLRTRMGRFTDARSQHTDFGVVQDVTAEHVAREALSRQLELIENITSRVPGILYQAHLTPAGVGSFPYLSPAAAEMLELDAENLRSHGNALFSRVHPQDKKALVLSILGSARSLRPWQHRFRVCLPVRGERWYSAEAMPHAQPDGSVIWYGFVNDVTAAHEAEQVQLRQHRMLEAVRQALAVFIEADDKRSSFEGLLASFLAVTQSSYGFLGEVLYDETDQPYLRTTAITNIAWDEPSRRMYEAGAEQGMEFRNPNTLFGHALATGEPVISNDPATDPRAGGLAQGHVALKHFLGIPLAAGNRLVAMVGLANQPGGYSEADVRFLQPLLGALRQLVLAWRGHAERRSARLQLQATSAALAEKSAALQATFDSMNQGLTMVDAQGRVRFFNRRMLDLLDLPEALLARQPMLSEVVAFQRERGDLESLKDAPEGLLSRDPMDDPPERYLRATALGTVLEVGTRVLPDGGMVRTYTDVTPYVQAQEALRDERQRLQWVLEATRPGIWETNLETGEMRINERWAQMLGYTIAELEPVRLDTWRTLVHPQDLAHAEHLLQQHWDQASAYYECDLRMRHRDGHWVWVNDRGQVHRRDEQGRALFMSGTHLDISERMAAQEQVRLLNASLERRVSERTAALERTMKDMEVISYSMAHDLRAPLRTVNGFASLIAQEEAQGLSPSGRAMFERIARASRSMGQMITDMLELLRVVQVALVAGPVDMNALAQSAVETLGPSAPTARIELQPLPGVMGDATLLRQVLVNLLDNALKYSRHQGQPEITLGHDRERHAFFIRDNGRGFDMARANKLFGLFQRLHAGQEVPGTGVGLAIVARIVERHGGRIWAESSPEQGATFWWTLPADVSDGVSG